MEPNDATGQTPSPPQPPEPHPHFLSHLTSRTAFVWMGIITILLAAEAGFLYYKNAALSAQLNNINKNPQLPPNNTDTPTSGPTIFISSDYGFQIVPPTKQTIIDQSQQNGSVTNGGRTYITKQLTSDGSYPNALSIRLIFGWTSPSVSPYQTIRSTKKTIDGVSWYTFYRERAPNTGCYYAFAQTLTSDKKNTIEIGNGEDCHGNLATNPSLIPLENTLSTFQFIPVSNPPVLIPPIPADSQTPAAGTCNSLVGNTVSFSLNIDTPYPRCLRLYSGQHLTLVNGTENPISVKWATLDNMLAPHESFIVPDEVIAALQPGVHDITTSLYGGGGPEVWVQSTQSTGSARTSCTSDTDCPSGYRCLAPGPLQAGVQPPKYCYGPGEAIPL